MTADDGLVAIDEVARRLGLRASAIRYYEERGLVEPAARRGGRRWYRFEQVRRLAVIRYWQASGLMTLDEIAEMVAGPSAASRSWSAVVEDRIALLTGQIDAMVEARDFLEHVLAFHQGGSPDGCSHYEELIWHRPARTGTSRPAPGTGRSRPTTPPATGR